MPGYVMWNDAEGTAGGALFAPNTNLLPPARPGFEWRQIEGDPAVTTLKQTAQGVVECAIEMATDIALFFARERKVGAAKEYLGTLLSRSCDTSIGSVQCDPGSQALLTSMAVDAREDMAAGIPWSIRWRRTDNSWTDEMGGDEFIAFAKEVAEYVKQRREVCWSIVDTIRTASSIDDIDAIDVTHGYPAS